VQGSRSSSEITGRLARLCWISTTGTSSSSLSMRKGALFGSHDEIVRVHCSLFDPNQQEITHKREIPGVQAAGLLFRITLPGRADSNCRPLGPEPSALGCSLPRAAEGPTSGSPVLRARRARSTGTPAFEGSGRFGPGFADVGLGRCIAVRCRYSGADVEPFCQMRCTSGRRSASGSWPTKRVGVRAILRVNPHRSRSCHSARRVRPHRASCRR
jgi:hypothetical protein